jgi:hypothetical protein
VGAYDDTVPCVCSNLLLGSTAYADGSFLFIPVRARLCMRLMLTRTLKGAASNEVLLVHKQAGYRLAAQRTYAYACDVCVCCDSDVTHAV